MGNNQLLTLLVFIPILGYSQTNISGGIYQNTTWSASGNPYIASGNVVVFEDITLTIEPGVIIKFNSAASLEIRGKLIAIGNSKDSIHFTSNLSQPVRNSWNGIIVKGTNSQTGHGNQVTMEFCVGEYANYFIDLDIAYEGPYVFKHCYFGNNYQTNKDGGIPETIFENCKFDSNIQAIGSSGYELRVINCEFVFNKYGVGGADLVDSCYFSNNSEAALLGNGIVQNCTIVNNNIGVDCAFNSGANTFINNIVKNNIIGIRMQKYFIGSINFTGNIICANSTYNLELLDFNNAPIPFNCWCSEDSTYIRSTIFDGYVNTNYGLVTYTPLADDCPEMAVSVEPKLNSEISIVTVYPNPFTNVLNVKLNDNLNGEIIFYNQNGQRVLNYFVTAFTTVNTSHLAPGVFIYEVKTNEKTLKIGRIVKVE